MCRCNAAARSQTAPEWRVRVQCLSWTSAQPWAWDGYDLRETMSRAWGWGAVCQGTQAMQLSGSPWLSTAPQAAPRPPPSFLPASSVSLPSGSRCTYPKGCRGQRAVGSRQTPLLLHLGLGLVETGAELDGGMERCVLAGLGTETSGRCVGATQDCIHPGYGRS